MRICILSQSRLEVVGGVESYVKSLSEWLLANQNDVIVISRSLYKVNSSPKSQKNDNRILRVPQFIYMLWLFFSSFFAIRTVLKENRRKRIDIIHAVDSGYSGFAGLIASRLTGIPLCYSVHSERRFLLAQHFNGFLGWAQSCFDFSIEHLVYSKSHGIIAVSSNLKNYVIRYRINPEKVTVIPVAIQVSAFQGTIDISKRNSLLNIVENSIVIGYVGRLEPEKNVISLIQALSEALKVKKDIVLVLVGNGSLMNNLKESAELLGISDNLRFLGSQNNVPFWLRLFDVFVLPSYTEGMPIALLEAMAAGKAIIASDIPGIRGMVNNQNAALMFNPRQPRQLAELILMLCNDQAVRCRLRSQAMQQATKYDYGAVYPRIRFFYRDLVLR